MFEFLLYFAFRTVDSVQFILQFVWYYFSVNDGLIKADIFVFRTEQNIFVFRR